MKIDIFNASKRYKIIYADPPWEYKQGGRGAAKKHYKTMKTEEIAALPVRELCEDDALLFMWATFPNITEAFDVMRAWGFTYKTAAFVWVKKYKSGGNFVGMGQYTRANAEVCLLGISKKTKAKEIVRAHDVRQIIEAEIRRHSEKPPEVRDRIMRLTGGGAPWSSLLAPPRTVGTRGVMRYDGIHHLARARRVRRVFPLLCACGGKP